MGSNQVGMCTPYTYVVDACDLDRYLRYGWRYPQEGRDGLTYEWELVAVSNPQSGQFIGATNEPNVVWRSPPCIGTVKLRVRVDDLAQISKDPNVDCPGSNRNDPYIVAEATVDMVLPQGCNLGQGSVDFQWRDVVPGNPCRPGDCGVTLADMGSEGWQAVYNGCAWRPVCVIYGGVQQAICVSDWSCSSPWPVTADNFEYWVLKFRETGSDPNNANLTGCYEGGPKDVNCIQIHENKHKADLKEKFEKELPDFLNEAGVFNQIMVNCSDPNTHTCQAAALTFEKRVDDMIEEWFYGPDRDPQKLEGINGWMKTEGERLARQAAASCYRAFAEEICRCACQRGWVDPNSNVCDCGLNN